MPTKPEVMKRLQTNVLNIVSDENISITPLSLWRGKEISPSAIANRISLLSRVVTGKERSIRVIMTIRRQDRWLASRYAESAKLFEIANQVDFEERVSAILAKEGRRNNGWLNYFDTVDAISHRLDRDKVLVLMQEELEADPSSWTGQLEAFLGVTDLTGILLDHDVRPRNVLSTGANCWKLRGHQAEIELTEQLSKSILTTYSESNEKLAKRFSVDGARFGYY